MRKSVQQLLIVLLSVIALAAMGTYIYIQSREFVRGPYIEITTPANGSLFSEPLIVVRGIAKNIAALSLNDAPIFTDSQGRFSEQLLLLSGYNILTLKAQDRFGKKVEETLELVYKPATQETSTSTSATPRMREPKLLTTKCDIIRS